MYIEKIKQDLTDYWRNIDKKIFFSFLLLFFLGLFFSFSSTSSLAGERLNKNYYFFFYKHLIFVFISILVMFFISFIKVEILKKMTFYLFIISFLLLALVPFFGIEVKGAKRWLNFYFFRFQPIELLKPFFILATAKILLLDKNKINNISYFVSFLILVSVLIFLVNQPDIGQSILLIGTWIAIVFISGISIFYIISFFAVAIAFISSLLFFFPGKFGYISNRLIAFVDPAKGDTFQSEKALEAIKEGGIKGQGMGEGILKENLVLPHARYCML